MKKNYFFPGLLLLLTGTSFCQNNLVFQGNVKCYIADDPRSTRGAKNVIVVPGFVPIKTGVTGPQGYYEVNTSAPMQKLEGKYVTVYYISSCKSCESKKNIFVSEDQVKVNATKHLSYLTIETLQMNAGCSKTELKPLQTDSLLYAFSHQQAQDLEKASAYNVVTATPAFVNLLTNVVAVGAIGGISSDADIVTILPGKIAYGQFLLASPMSLSTNTGFNFSPSRDLSEAVLWNPSSLANSYHNGGVYLLSNLKSNHKFTAFAKISEQFTLGLGGLYTKQDELRLTRYETLNGIPQHLRQLKEYAAYLTPVVKVGKNLSVAVAGKSIWQNFNRPARIEVQGLQPPYKNTFIDSTVNQQKFDADVSVSYKLSPSFQLGLNAMNLAGTELFADALPVKKKVVPVQKLRSLGVGLCYKWKQFNFGTDILLTEDDLYDISVGVNYIPFNNALLSGGFAFKQKSFSLSYRMKYFKLGYVNDNSFMINEKRNPKNSIFNGYLYSGLAFDF
ncbi:MAG: hypothetical protein M3Y85_04770 [Bacteroidota bacterium]|nr:hypothetical protein [Bacteroidota bacterium]